MVAAANAQPTHTGYTGTPGGSLNLFILMHVELVVRTSTAEYAKLIQEMQLCLIWA